MTHYRTFDSVPFSSVEDLLRRSIVSEYGVKAVDLVPFGGDPLEWAHYPGDGTVRPGVEAFRKRYQP